MSTPASNDAASSPPMSQEADIGSGEKTPAQKETEEMIRQIPPLPPTGEPEPADQPGIVSPS